MTAEPIGRRGRRTCARLLIGPISSAVDATSPTRRASSGPANVELPGGGGIRDVQPKKRGVSVFWDRTRSHATIHLRLGCQCGKNIASNIAI